MLTEKEATITDFDIFIEDHGILTFFFTLKYGAAVQGAGGYALDTYVEKEEKRRVGTRYLADLLLATFRTFACTSIKDVIGKPCFAIIDQDTDFIVGLRAFNSDRTMLFKDIFQPQE